MNSNLLTPSVHESHYDVVAAAIAGASATMLTLMVTLGSSISFFRSNFTMKSLFEAELLVLELTLMIAVIALLKRNDDGKKRLAHASALVMILGTLLLWVSATLLIYTS